MTDWAPPLRLHLGPPRRHAAATLMLRGMPRRREAVRITLQDDHGHLGHGEAMPLPGYSRDDAAGAERVLQALRERTEGSGLRLQAHPPARDGNRPRGAGAVLAAALAPHEQLLQASVSARFALECAIVDLLSRRAGLGAATWLAGGRALQAVPISVLLPDDDAAVVDAAVAAAAAGYAVLKLKIARADRNESAEERLLATLRAVLGPATRLRLDANGGLPPGQAAERLAILARHGIELVEEPLAGAALLDLPPIALPWAADESLAMDRLAEALLGLPAPRRPAALVLKPAMLGLTRCLQLADAASACGVGLIVTHSLDGDLGHAAACALAAALPAPPWPCGLAPHPGLSRTLAAQPWLTPPTELGLGCDGGGQSDEADDVDEADDADDADGAQGVVRADGRIPP